MAQQKFPHNRTAIYTPITYRYVHNQAIVAPAGLRLQSPGGVLQNQAKAHLSDVTERECHVTSNDRQETTCFQDEPV